MARFACKSSSTLSHCLSVINLAIQRNSKKEQEETRRLRITHRVSLVSKTTEGERLPQILLFAISSLGFVGLALLSALAFNQIPRLNQRLNHRSKRARLNIWLTIKSQSRALLAITGRLDEGRQPDNLVHTGRILPSEPDTKKHIISLEKYLTFISITSFLSQHRRQLTCQQIRDTTASPRSP